MNRVLQECELASRHPVHNILAEKSYCACYYYTNIPQDSGFEPPRLGAPRAIDPGQLWRPKLRLKSRIPWAKV